MEQLVLIQDQVLSNADVVLGTMATHVVRKLMNVSQDHAIMVLHVW